MDNEKASLWEGWWRWPLIPIISILGAFLGSAIFVLLEWLSMILRGNYSENSWYFYYILPLIREGLFGFLVVYLGCLVAPRGRLIVGVVLTTLLGAFFIGTVLMRVNGIPEITWFGVLSGLVMLVGGIIGVIQGNNE